MKKIILYLTVFVILCFGISQNVTSQVREHYALNSKLVTFNSTSGALTGQSAIMSTAVGDSNCTAFSYSLKSLTCFEGIFYPAVSTNLNQSAVYSSYLLKSTNGITWGPLVRIDDAPTDKGAYSGNIYVWRKKGCN